MTYDMTALTALSDPTRRLIFERLSIGPQPVGTLAHHLPISRPAVSQHLKVLKEARLINLKTVGNNNIYELNREGILAMRNYLDKFWDDALANFKALAEQTEKQK